jgi:O-antigen/teichoic acid export membrane protein
VSTAVDRVRDHEARHDSQVDARPDAGNRPSTQQSLLSGGTYALANSAQRALAFLLLPLYTAVLSSSEYGRLGLLLTVQAGAAVVLTAGMDSGVMRQFFQLEGEPAAQRRFVLTAWYFLAISAFVIAAIVALLLVLFAPSSSAFHPAEGALAVCGAAIFVAATVVPLTVLRAEHRLKDYLILTAVVSISTTALTVLFVVGLHLGVTGWLFASLIANGLTLVAGFFVIPSGSINIPDWKGLRAALRVGLPLVPHAASGWSLQLADRIILASIVTVSSLGVYTLAANLALPVLVVLQGLNLGFLPTYASQTKRRATQELRNAVSLQVGLTLIVGCALALLAPPAVSFLSVGYAGAAELVPWIVLGYVFLGLYFIPMNVISMMVGRTTFVWTLTLAAAAINIGAIYLLVPTYGILGAAEASALGYGVLLMLVSLYAHLFEIRPSIDWKRVLPMTCVVGGTYVVGTALLPVEGATGIAAQTALLSTLVVTLPLAVGARASDAMAQIRRLRSRMRKSKVKS